MARPPYPFIPRSNAHLEQGQYWGIPLTNGHWACGRVLGVDRTRRYGTRTSFIAAVHDWMGEKRPTDTDVTPLSTYLMRKSYAVHVRALTLYGFSIDGIAPFAAPDLPVQIGVSGHYFLGGTDLGPNHEGTSSVIALGALNVDGLFMMANRILANATAEERTELARQLGRDVDA